MTAQAKGWIVAAALSGGFSVISGAFAAHGFNPVTDAKAIGWLQTGSSYEAIHALAMLAVVVLAGTGRLHPRWAVLAQGFFLAGSVLFSGALYILALSGPHWLGMVAPLGGLSLIAGWAALALAAFLRPRVE